MLWSNLLSLITFDFGSRWTAPHEASNLPHHHEPRSTLSPEMTRFVEGIRTKYGVSSFGIGTVHKDGHGEWVSSTGAFGTANFQGDPVTEDSLFSVASNSKLFTMISVGMLIENGTLLPNGEPIRWNTKMKAIFPELEFPEPSMNDLVDIVDFMSMRSGMPRHDLALTMEPVEDYIKAFKHVKPSAEVRQYAQYNNWHYMVLSHIIPTLTGTQWHEFIQTEIFDKIGMDGAYINATAAAESGLWTDGTARLGMNWVECERQWGTEQGLDEACLGRVAPFGAWGEGDTLSNAGAGGVILSPKDMTKWVKELLDPQVISSDLISRAAHPHLPLSPETPYPEIGVQSYGQGQLTYSYRGHKVVMHTGGVPGQSSILLRLVDDDFGVMLATNEADLTWLIYVVGYRFLDHHLGLEPIDWEERYLEDWIKKLGEGKDLPDRPEPPQNPNTITGEYHHPVYGPLKMSLLDTRHEATKSSLQALDSPRINITGPIYVTPLSKVFSSHLIFTHFSGNAYNWTAALLKSTLETDRSKSDQVFVVASAASGSAYVDGSGIGMFGNFWGAGAEVPVVHAEADMEDVEESAEVWFARV